MTYNVFGRTLNLAQLNSTIHFITIAYTATHIRTTCSLRWTVSMVGERIISEVQREGSMSTCGWSCWCGRSHVRRHRCLRTMRSAICCITHIKRHFVIHAVVYGPITYDILAWRQPCQHLISQIFTGQMPFLTPNQQRQSKVNKQKHNVSTVICQKKITKSMYIVTQNATMPLYHSPYSTWCALRGYLIYSKHLKIVKRVFFTKPHPFSLMHYDLTKKILKH